MPSKTISVTNGDGSTRTITIPDRSRFAGVRNISRKGKLDDETTSIQVTVAGHSDLDGVYTTYNGLASGGADQWLQQGGTGQINATYNSENNDTMWFVFDSADNDPDDGDSATKWFDTGVVDRPWKSLGSNTPAVTITGISGTETITVDRSSDRKGESRPLLSKVVGGAAAAYSLRDLNDKQGNNKVVRVRRASDNHERDFLAKEVSNGTLKNWVNTQTVLPLDTRALTSTGRDGDFLIAKAAYSLRSLGTRQATVTSSGDTAGDTSGKFVCQVRKDQSSTTDDTKSFTADEVSDGTLVDFILGNTKSLLNSRAFFDGSDDNVKLTSEINMTGDFSLKYTFVVTIASQQILGKEASGSYLRAEGSGEISGFRIQTDSGASTVSLTSNLKFGEANTVKLKRVSGKLGIYNESDVLISAEFTNSDTFTVSSFGRARGTRAKGVVYNIRIDTNNDGTINHSYNGYGNTLSDWTDLVGSNNASAVNGSPALFTGQDQDGFVKTWYDQSVTTQAGDTATGNHATQATDAEQPKIVDAGSLITGGGIAFDGSDDQLDFTALNATDLAIFSAVKFDSVSGQERILGEDSTNGEGFGIGSATTGFFRGNGGSSSGPALNATVSTSGDFLFSGNRASNTLGFFTNGVASATATNSDAFKANSIGGHTNPIDGNVKEVIIYDTYEFPQLVLIPSFVQFVRPE